MELAFKLALIYISSHPGSKHPLYLPAPCPYCHRDPLRTGVTWHQRMFCGYLQTMSRPDILLTKNHFKNALKLLNIPKYWQNSARYILFFRVSIDGFWDQAGVRRNRAQYWWDENVLQIYHPFYYIACSVEKLPKLFDRMSGCALGCV